MGAASNLFFASDRSVDTLNKRVRPDDSQIERLRTKKDDLVEHLCADLASRCGCPVSTWLQGSYKLGTLVRPLHGQDYDVDVGVYLEWGNGHGDYLSNDQVRARLQESLLEFGATDRSVKSVADPPKERCSRVHYEKHFHIDAPAYHHNVDTGVARLATLSNGWEFSDPEKMVDWFRDRLEGEERAQVRRLTRYLKGWSAFHFKDDRAAAPSSLMLTVLAVEAYEATIGGVDRDDDDALAVIADSIFWRLSGSRHVENPVPTDQDRNLNRMSEDAFDRFMTELYGLVDISRRATGCEAEADAAAVWTEAFDYLFPLPDIVGVAEAADEGRGLLVQTPDIRIDVMTGRAGPVRRTDSGQVDEVRIGEWLRFRIENRSDLPAAAEVRWVVRNVGEQAFMEDDLGHSTPDDGKFQRLEHASYHGRHFMDCEVRVDGRLRSITRIPVAVTGLPVPPRHPARHPAYRRLVGRGRNR